MKDEFSKELEQLLEKHKVKTAIMLFEQKPPKDTYRTMVISEDEEMTECDFAHVFEGCANNSKGFQGILEHVTNHSVLHLMEHAMGDSEKDLHKKGRRAD